ncbi:biotin carboxylase [Kineobactrum sediminis]|uniref:Biotin carboxylase n=1 Tax=Kineobactrum sediminis TaxID=1905677 RepID=A0A2N5Y3X7_9GAMM|nr:carboxyl transferase domain-containing protein [Kineobactrum sediminis]PLW83100.1 biotin carboxylase [Kineobactrum sediminis]
MTDELRPELQALQQRLQRTLDEGRDAARVRRHQAGYRSARENLADLVDTGTFQEYGQLAVAAQRNRRDYQELQTSTAADGIITGTATINAGSVGVGAARVAVIINDYAVLAGTQGFFHHRKLDRLCALAESSQLPIIMYTEGGGGRPGDTDVLTHIAGLHVESFSRWAALSGKVPRIAVNNGYCFAGNAALFGCADITIATRTSWIGMAGPAMIEGGGLGKVDAREIGPIDVQLKNGVVDIVAEDEAHATALAKQALSYFQGPVQDWACTDQAPLRDLVPLDRRWAYPVRKVIETIADTGSFLELRRVYGRSIITGFIRLEGQPVALIANDCQQLGGAVDAESSEKAARFLQLVNAFGLPVLSLTDTPGFMVGPASERDAAVRRMSSLFITGAAMRVPMVAIFLRKGYGLGAMAMTGGSFAAPVYAAAWPTGEFGAMGLEGAVRLGYRKELEAVADPGEREALFERLVADLYEAGKATEAASYLEIDAVIDPIDTRLEIVRALRAAAVGGK